MLKEKERLFRNIVMLLDACMVSLAFLAAYLIRSHFHLFYKFDFIPSREVVTQPAEFSWYLTVLAICLPIWLLMLAFSGIYHSLRTRSILEIIGRVINAAFFSALAFGTLAFVFKIHFVSRIFFVLFVIFSCLLLIFEKASFFLLSRYFRSIGYNIRWILIVGTGPRAKRFVQMIKSHPEWGYSIVGLVDDSKERLGRRFFGIKVIGVLDNMPRILQENIIDEVIFVVPRMWLQRIQKSIAACELQGIKTSVAADLFNLRIARAHQTDLNGMPLLTFETTFGQEWQLFLKRLFDVGVSFFGLIVLFPLMLVVALLIKLSSPGAVFFRQKRTTLNGRIFALYKFRTMYQGAEEQLAELEHLNEMDGPVFKIKRDPRITPLGRYLRKLSIDELPQLFNVLSGQMSLVGPRPPIPDEVHKYQLWQRRRLSMRPGLTCLWQAGGRNKIDFQRWMELDLRYIDNWSLWLDVKILLKTIPVVLFGIGAG